MINFFDQPRRLPGTLITLDGPGGVGKSTAAKLVADTLIAAGVPVLATAQPSRAPLGELARHGTDTYRGMSPACLCAADRHQQLDAEIKPALREGQAVICDRYVASSLVPQGLDGLSAETAWQLNHGVYRPDLSVIYTQIRSHTAGRAARLSATATTTPTAHRHSSNSSLPASTSTKPGRSRQTDRA